MNKWQKYVAEAISLNSRGKHLEQAINFTGIFHRLSPTQILEKLELAQGANKLYQKASRICKLLISVGDPSLAADMNRIDIQLDSNLRRIGDIINILNKKAEKFGLEEKPKELSKDDVEPLSDVAQANDNSFGKSPDYDTTFDQDPDMWRSKIKYKLKEINDLMNYMEPKTLAKIYEDLKKIVDS